jgi:hypothetical protein
MTLRFFKKKRFVGFKSSPRPQRNFFRVLKGIEKVGIPFAP